jgi:outer membrane receptor protein involved in Fe transport
MGGFSVLANVVRRHGTRSESLAETGVLASTDGWLAPQGRAEYGLHRDGRTLDLALKLVPEFDDDSGHGSIRTLAPQQGGDATRRWDTRTTKNTGEANATWKQPLGDGKLTLAATLRREQERVDTDFAADAADASETIAENTDTDEAEFGARYQRDLGTGTTLGMMASQHLGWIDDVERSREDGDEETFDARSRSGESIGRIDLTHAWSEQWSLATSLEGAYNVLRSDARLQQGGITVAVPGSAVHVEEKRVEGAATATWTPTGAVAVDAGLQLERSIISESGETALSRSFVYPKPRLALRWDIDPRNRVRTSLAREVGQLDFTDFAASASLDTGLVSAGNAELEPDSTWQFNLAWEHHLRGDGAFTIGWTHDRITDVIDRVLVTSGDDVFDAPGNIGGGRRDTLALDLSLPLDGLGLTNARLRSLMQWHRSRVTDPVTGEQRGISEEKPVEGEIALTQDLPALATNWGLTLEHIAERKDKYRFDRVERESERMGWTLFVEHRLNARWHVRAEMTDLFGRNFADDRDSYAGPRNISSIEEIERRRRTSPGYAIVSFRRELSAGG